MGLLDLFKPKSKSTNQPSNKPGRAECDISKTQVMIDLFQIPEDKRNDDWKKSLFENVQSASYSCSSPQTFTGPDGFPYFILRTPEADKPFESFCIKNMKDDFLLEKGLGVALNPKENNADWVFSYGDILNLHINQEFLSATTNPELPNNEVIKKSEEILIAQPSESYFPKQARHVLKKFLQRIGIKRPMLMMICSKIEGQIVQELVFNLFAEDFSDTNQLNYHLKQISWFLPRHYVILSIPKNSNLAKHFNDL
jgi:hypothetical protein